MDEQRIGKSLVLADGRRLGFAEYGDPGGQPVFHFHGSGGSRLDRPAREAVLWEAGIRLICVDRPGHGVSDFQPSRRLVDWPQDVSQLAHALALPQFYVEGWSAGGPHALACASQLPDRILAVALLASAAPVNRPGAFAGLPLPNLALAAAARWAPPLAGLFRRLTRRMLLRDAELASRHFMASIPEADKAVLYEPENLAVFVQSLSEGFRPGWKGVTQDDVIVRQDWGFELGSIRVPIDIWQGENDVNVLPTDARYLGNVLPQARSFFLPGEGHFFVLRRWAEVLSTLISRR
jgi:pimeloyl-ACP methyl ester carboxylesterase